jgi:hypothetical protein
MGTTGLDHSLILKDDQENYGNCVRLVRYQYDMIVF